MDWKLKTYSFIRAVREPPLLRGQAMKQWAYIIFISLITVICICFIALNMRSVRRVSSATIELEQYKKEIADLEGQIKKDGSKRRFRPCSGIEKQIRKLLKICGK